MSIVSAMEVLQPIRAALQEKGLRWEEKCRQLEQSLRRYGIRFVVPDVVIMADAYEYFWTNHLDPFDAITVSVAIHQNSDAIISRDRNLRRSEFGGKWKNEKAIREILVEKTALESYRKGLEG